MFAVYLSALLIAAGVFYAWQWYNYTYWKRKGVKQVAPLPLAGNFASMLTMKRSLGMRLQELYNERGWERDPYVGVFLLVRPTLLLRDVQLIKKVLIKDFTNFVNRVGGADPHHDPLGFYNLFFVRTPMWRELRAKLSPVFTSGKIKQMYPLMVEVGRELDEHMRTQPSGGIMEFRDICGRFTTQLIGTIAFGVQCNSIRNPKSDFYVYSRAIFALTLRRTFDLVVSFAAPKLTKIFRTKVFSAETSDFIRHSMRHVLGEREKSGVVRNDLIDVLVAMKREAAENPSKTNPANNFDFLVAQAMVFQSAGFETSSSTMSYALYEMAKAPHMQERLRAEIAEAFKEHGDWISYERIHEMTYLGMVIDETLRKYPVLPFLERECINDYQLTDELRLDKGTAIYISALGLHYDETYWPEPHKFDPERFAPENRDKLNRDAYMPFGVGPRNCIGMRLGLLQTKLGLVHLLRGHRVAECAKTQSRIEFQPQIILLAPIGGIHLELQRCD